MRFLSPEKLPWLKKLKARDISGVVVFGDVHGSITQGNVSDLSLNWAPVRAGQTELAWLNWRTRLADLEGRDTYKTELIDWAKQAERGVLGRFVTGEGGVGKTRLAAEVANALRNANWAAGFVDLNSPGSYFAKKAGTLVLIDYPEERREGVRTLLENLSRVETENRIRLLFLSRRGWDVWQQEIAGADGAINFFDKESIALPPLAGETAYAIFQSAQKRLAHEKKVGPQPVNQKDFTDWLNHNAIHHRPLFLVAAAIHSVLHPEVSVITLSGREVVEALAQRELARLADEGANAGMAPEALPRLAAFAAIRGDLSGAELKFLAKNADLDLGLPPPNKIMDAVGRSGRLEKGVFPAPSPDIVAACMVVKVFSQNLYRAPEWLWVAIERKFDDGLARVGRLAHDAEVVLGLHTQRISHWLESAVRGEQTRSQALLSFIEGERSDTRVEGGLLPAVVVARLIMIESAEGDELKAVRLQNLAVDLGSLGDIQGGLDAIRKAVEIQRRLAEAEPARFEPDLAGSLNTLSNRLGDAGDREGALDAIRKAVEIQRRLAEPEPARFEPDLAGSLQNLSIRLSDAGDREGSLDAIRKAVEIDRRLAEAEPARFEIHLASSLNILSNRLSDAGDREGALDTIRKAVEIRRRLAEAEPARFEIDLASSLNNLSIRLSDAGDREGALDTIRKAVEIRRRLAEAEPARFEVDLASSLNNLSNRLSDAGDREGSLDAIRKAVEIHRRLAEAEPARFEVDLASSLNNLSIQLSDAGDREGALDTIRKAVEIHRRLAEAEPARFEPDLATSLNNLSNRLSDAGDKEGALDAIRKAVEIHRRLAEAEPAHFEVDLASSLGALGSCLRAAGSIADARSAFAEGVRLVEPHPERFPEGPAGRLLRLLRKHLKILESKG